MADQTSAKDLRRVVTAGGPPAVITAGIGVGATGVAGRGIESETKPVERDLAGTVGIDPQFGPALLLAVAVLVLAVAFVVPGLFEGTH